MDMPNLTDKNRDITFITCFEYKGLKVINASDEILSISLKKDKKNIFFNTVFIAYIYLRININLF